MTDEENSSKNFRKDSKTDEFEIVSVDDLSKRKDSQGNDSYITGSTLFTKVDIFQTIEGMNMCRSVFDIYKIILEYYKANGQHDVSKKDRTSLLKMILDDSIPTSLSICMMMILSRAHCNIRTKVDYLDKTKVVNIQQINKPTVDDYKMTARRFFDTKHLQEDNIESALCDKIAIHAFLSTYTFILYAERNNKGKYHKNNTGMKYLSIMISYEYHMSKLQLSTMDSNEYDKQIYDKYYKDTLCEGDTYKDNDYKNIYNIFVHTMRESGLMKCFSTLTNEHIRLYNRFIEMLRNNDNLQRAILVVTV